MEFQTKIIVLSIITSFVVSLLIIPILKRLKVGQMERTEGPQSHLKKQGTPTMGGIIMIITILLVGIFAFFTYYKSENQLEKQSAMSLIPFLKTFITLPIWIYIPFAVFVMLATTNAVNLTDGIDGLATSVSTIIFTCLTVIGFISGIKEITIFGGILIGTCLGFLLFNLHPAKVMMGDTGSLLLGGAIVSMALYLKMPLLLPIIALIPVIETLSVIIQVKHFKKTGKRIFKMTPIHHHFELSGWNENKIVSIFSFVTLICCVIGLASI